MKMSLRRPLLVLWLLLVPFVALAQAVAPPALPPLVRAPTDEAQFRRFVLDNGLRVLLVSDPKFNKSAAALAVNVGQIDDPADSEGLAHFTEHMLFLGTAKYPREDEYWRFMRANGGFNNAYTTSDHTNYLFEVRHEALPEALDRFAQFFVAPLFTPEFTQREVSAVHNEAMRHVQNDVRRLIGVRRELYAPGSGEAKFSVGNRDTLARATPAAVRAFYERHYSADRMALAITGRAPLDELERLARTTFAAIPRRPGLPPVKREATFLPPKPALRMAFVEPVREVRQLQLEFVVPPTRPHFVSHPATLVGELLRHAGAGGLLSRLKADGLANGIGADLSERTGEYGSFLVSVDLTPQGQQDVMRVLELVYAYLQQLRQAPFPAELYAGLARIGQLQETYGNRGEGTALASRLAVQALFYPLEVAERATTAWGPPDEAAYRTLLGALQPANALVTLMAKGVPTDRRERIYGTAYSYREDPGAAYARLVDPPAERFVLPGTNRFMPQATPVLAERPLRLIDEPALSLYYAADTEFLRPQTTVVLRFVPVREVASAEGAALLTLWSRCLADVIDADLTEARHAGIAMASDFALEGLRLSITGWGDAPLAFARHVAQRLPSFAPTPARFAAVKEAALRALQSYAETEAAFAARDRRDALAREFHYLPPQLVAHVEKATWPDVAAFGRRLLARGKLEAVVHGHTTGAEAVRVARDVAAALGARAAEPAQLLRRRHLVIAPGENVVDHGLIAGVNAAYVADYLLGDDTPRTQAAAMLISALVSPAYFSELRTRQQLGYIVSAGATSSLRERFLTFFVQSTEYGPDELRRRSEAFIATLPARLAATTPAEWQTLKAGVRSQLEEKPKSIGERAERWFNIAHLFDEEWDRRPQAIAALETLTVDEVSRLLAAAIDERTARRRTVLLHDAKHAASTAAAAFADREAWKRTRQYR